MLAPMLLVRSLVFNVAFYLNLLLWMLVFLPTLLMPRKVLLRAAQALAAMNRRARAEIAAGRQILIFPEGTRRAAGAPPAYKFGVAHLYRAFGVACLPVALNSGLYWPRRQFIRRPGTVVIEILEPIPPGLSRDVLLQELQDRIETASNRLLAEGLADLGPAHALAGAGAR
jgi:1-acyl-sn-glycerol-3-phosphate acyltransferase